MTTIYTRENFTPDVIPRQFDQGSKNLIRMAVGVGWSLLVTKRGHCTLKACHPNEHITINLRSHRSSEGPMKGLVKKVNKYANPMLAISEKEPSTVEEEEAYITQIASRFAQQEATAAERSSVSTEPVLLSDGPMMARRGKNKGYPSETTRERRWRQGTKEWSEFYCSLEGCSSGEDGGPFTSENRMSVSSHYRTHTHRGEAEHPSKDKATVVIPPYEPAYHKDNYTPRADRVRALASVLKAAMEAGLDWDDLDAAAETLAAEALAWSHQQSTSSSLLAAEREPLTAEERLDVIRNMLDDGLYMSQREEIETLRLRLHEIEERERAATAAAEDLQETLDALRDLIPHKKKVTA